MPEDRLKVRYEEFKGHPMIILPLGRDFKGKEQEFSFGLKKAKAILEYAQEIRDFVLSNE